MGDDGGELLVVHQQHLDVRRSLDQEGVQAVLQLEAGRLLRAITDLRHEDGTLELSSDSVIDTAGLSPRRLNTEYIQDVKTLNIP